MKELCFETKRLIIRPLNNHDYESWLAGFLNREKSKSKYDKGYMDMSGYNKEWFKKIVAKHKKLIESDDKYIFSIFDKYGNHLGMINIITIERDNFQWGECGYFIHNQLWRKGYASEAMIELIKQAKKTLGFHRLEGDVNLDNVDSFKLLEKIGFKYECTREGFIFEFGEWTDNYIYYINLHNDKL